MEGIYDVSIHAPYAGSDDYLSAVREQYEEVSIHAPYAGSDSMRSISPDGIIQFQSTPPMQGATTILHGQGIDYKVSIHAPYAGSDD